jgi:hypothetical protein
MTATAITTFDIAVLHPAL